MNKEQVRGLVVSTLVVSNLVYIPAASAANAPHSKPKSSEPEKYIMKYPQTLLEKIGITSTRSLNKEESAKFKINKGLMIERVEGRAALSGIQPGDVLLYINGRDTRFGKTEKLPNDFPSIIVLLVLREDERLPIAVQLPPEQRPLRTGFTE